MYMVAVKTQPVTPIMNEFFLNKSKIDSEMTDLSYEQRPRVLKLPSLTYRRIRGDMMLYYKIFTKKCDYDPKKLFKNRNEMTKRNIRGHHLTLIFKPRAHLNMRKYSFTYRSIDIWNSLSP